MRARFSHLPQLHETAAVVLEHGACSLLALVALLATQLGRSLQRTLCSALLRIDSCAEYSKNLLEHDKHEILYNQCERVCGGTPHVRAHWEQCGKIGGDATGGRRQSVSVPRALCGLRAILGLAFRGVSGCGACLVRTPSCLPV